MTRKEMMDYIDDTLEEASDGLLAEVYWFLKIELGD